MAESGKVYLVGAGPGDPGLLTVRGQELLALADVVLYDALSHPAVLAHCRPDAELRDVGKRGGSISPSQDWITEQLIRLAGDGKRVVRLKGGDSFLFARGAEEAEALAEAGVAFEVVPGLSSPVGTSAYAGIPLTHREYSSSVTFITGTDKRAEPLGAEAWRKLATATDTICILMGMRRIREIAAAIIDGGRPAETQVAVVQWGARPEQRVLVSTLERVADDVAASQMANPAVIIIGRVVELRQQLRWFDALPAFGKRILVPRPPHQAASTMKAIRERGAEPVAFPVIRIEAPPQPELVTKAIEHLSEYDWVLFTSANGVERFFSALEERGLDARALGGCRVGVIGPKTGAALAPRGIRADLVAEEYVGEGLAEAVLEHGAKRVLIPRALVAREELPALLRQHGAQVDVVPVYQTLGLQDDQAKQLARLLEDKQVDVVMFTSSSTVTHTVKALGARARDVLATVVVASIGPVTSRTLAQHQIDVDVTAEVFTIDGLLGALDRYFASGAA